MGGSLKIATVAGIDIRVHATFLFVVLLGAWQWGDQGARGAVFGAVLMLAVFACVVLHELGHSLVARAFGVPVKNITLYPIGGVAQLGKRPDTPMQELFVALAGPMVNVALAAVLLLGLVWQYGFDSMWTTFTQPGAMTPSLQTLHTVLILSNVMLAVFNMVPAFPMDGGRVLRAVLAMVLKEPRATKVAVVVSRALAIGMMAMGLFNPGYLMLAVVALFVFLAGGAELRETQLQHALKGIRAGDAVNPYVPRFTPATTLGEALQALVFVPHQAFAVEHFGRLVGVVTRQAVLRAAEDEGASGYLAGVMDREVPTLRPNEALEQARLKMIESGRPYVAVVEGGLFLGLVTELELAQHLSLWQALQKPSARVVRAGSEGRL